MWRVGFEWPSIKWHCFFVFVVLLPGCQDEQVAGVWPANYFTNVIYCRLPFYAPIDTVSVPRVAANTLTLCFHLVLGPRALITQKHALPTKWQIITHYCCRLLLCRSCWITADACRWLTLSLRSDGKKLEENCGLLFLSQVEWPPVQLIASV